METAIHVTLSAGGLEVTHRPPQLPGRAGQTQPPQCQRPVKGNPEIFRPKQKLNGIEIKGHMAKR
ncbi:MAG TPA: hypothetical protein VNN22_01180 [Verrucomicrobiae bacterium]|nr:hypothetical protein [Verrucomicrobiae bacterium]